MTSIVYGTYALAGGTGVARDINSTLSRQVQVATGLRWNTIKPFARLNQQVGVHFMVQRIHADEAAACDFALTNMIGTTALPASGSLVISVTSGAASGGGTMADAMLQSAQSTQKGASTFTTYSFVGSEFV